MRNSISELNPFETYHEIFWYSCSVLILQQTYIWDPCWFATQTEEEDKVLPWTCRTLTASGLSCKWIWKCNWLLVQTPCGKLQEPFKLKADISVASEKIKASLDGKGLPIQVLLALNNWQIILVSNRNTKKTWVLRMGGTFCKFPLTEAKGELYCLFTWFLTKWQQKLIHFPTLNKKIPPECNLISHETTHIA